MARRVWAWLALAGLGVAGQAGEAGAQAARREISRSQYAAAERMLPANADKLVFRDKIVPQWIDGGNRFWYRVRTPAGAEFILVDPARRSRRPAFDHGRLAAELGRVLARGVAADSLPFETLTWEEKGKAPSILVVIEQKTYRCELDRYRCGQEESGPPRLPNELLSPDGKWGLSHRDHNLWLREVASGAEGQLTHDGVRRHAYGLHPESNTVWATVQRAGLPQPPMALWSPDSRRILTHRLDERGLAESHLIQSVPAEGLRPKLWSFVFPFPGDSLSQAQWLVIDVNSGGMTPLGGRFGMAYNSPIAFHEAWWGDSVTAYFISRERASKSYRLMQADARSGRVSALAEERGPTMVEATLMLGTRPNSRVLGGGRELVWFSQRDGWAQLYLVDGATGQVKNRITDGQYVVREIVHVDERARRIWFTAGGKEAGRDPYYRHLYSVGLDGTGLTLLTPEDAEHEISVSPNGRWAVDRVSRVDLAPRTVLRSMDGKTVLPLEAADLSALLATGWRYPERFTVKAADGTTDLYGIIITPPDFDSTRRYPVLEENYPGPQITLVPRAFTAGGDLRAMVTLGFVGVIVDGRGTPFRSKAFHDVSYGRLETAGSLEDHIAAFRQIGQTRRYLDLDRVGIYGHSGGGFASARAMFLYPDFYKVAVSSAGNHDQRGYLSLWGETYQGLPQGDNYAAQANQSIAANLKGKLLLAYADMDDNVSPWLTVQVIDALTKANKDYDLLIVPNGSHAMSANPYFRRRRWDYFVQHLMGAAPPAGYEITTKSEYPF
ncbi:MAG: DPP IV N-terminal domain-containing protein [Gemmatimonadales bacterium]|nr:DPP IV N-terminal domain-containing protein [Gemmatimonadales bacterium]